MSRFARRDKRYGVESLEPRTLLSAGALDTSFGVGGKAVVDLPAQIGDVTDILVQPDGKIVVAAHRSQLLGADADDDMLFVRLNSDGTLDDGFGGDGLVVLDFTDNDAAGSLALQPNGKIVAAGSYRVDDQTPGVPVLMRFNADGSLDDTFSDNGILVALSDSQEPMNGFLGVAVAADGKIVATGFGREYLGQSNSAVVARYLADGSPDNTFENNGREFFPFLGHDATSPFVGPDGRITVITNHYSPGQGWEQENDNAVRALRLNPDGSRDSSFGNGDGYVFFEAVRARDLEVRPDGKLLIAVHDYDPNSAGAGGLLRLNPDGSLDDTFANRVATGVSSFADMAVQPDGRIVATSPFGGVHRFNPNGSRDLAFSGALVGLGGAISTYGANQVVVASTSNDHNLLVHRINAGASDPSVAVAPLLKPRFEWENDVNDEVYLRRDGSWTHVWVNEPLDSPSSYMATVAEMANFELNTLDGTDVLKLDFSAGSPLPDAPMLFTGGTGNDTIEIIGGDGTEVVTFGDGWVGANFARADYVSTENFLVRTMGGNDTVNVNRVTGPVIDRGTVAVVVEGVAGDDTFHVGDGSVDTHLQGVGVTLKGGSGADVLVYDDGGGAPFEIQSYLLDQNLITKKFRGVVTQELAYESMGRIEIEAGAGMDLVHVRGLGEPVTVPARTVLPVELVVNSGGGNDDVVIGDGLLDNVVGPITVDAGAGNDDLVFDDDATLGAKTYTLTATSFARNTPFRNLTYANAESVRLEATRGNDAINVHSNTAPVTINARDGADLAVVGRTGTDGMNKVDAPVVVNGGGGSDRLVFEDAASGAVSKTYSLGPASFDRTDFPVVTYATTERVELRAGGGPDLINVVPAQDVSIGIDGMQPMTQPGDRLTVVPHGAQDPVHTPRPQFPGLGEFTFANRLKVDYQRVENARFGDFVAVHLFYNGSAFDGNDFAANAADDGAIATDKQALFAGGTASFANLTSYHRGINGLMVDLAPGSAALTAADFAFRMGDGTDPSAWPVLGAAFTPAVSTRAGAGVNGTSRVTLSFPDGAVRNTWLAVTVLANANTGLTEPLTFYAGNLVGEVGDPSTPNRVGGWDMYEFKRRPPAAPVPITNRFDVNRDGAYTVADRLIAHTNQQRSLAFFSPPLAAAQQAAAPTGSSGATRLTARRRGILADLAETPAADA